MRLKKIAPSHLPSFLLPCPQCRHHLAMSSSKPARLATGAESNDLEEVTHSCVHCGSTMTRTVRPLASPREIPRARAVVGMRRGGT
jgi:hypothetical protein